MRESRTYGSVRGARSNARPYRDRGSCSARARGWLGVTELQKRTLKPLKRLSRAQNRTPPRDPQHEERVGGAGEAETDS